MRPDPTRPDTRATAHPVLWLMAFVAILYLSLYPFGEWSLRRPGTFSWLFAYHRLNYSWGDLIVNIGAYAGFGYLTARQLQGRFTLPAVVLITSAGCTLLSFIMESLQSWLPRVPSLVDLATNGFGAVLGALVVVLVTTCAPLRALRDRAASLVFGRESEHKLRRFVAVLLVLWLASQAVPQPLLLATGPLTPWPGEGLLSVFLPFERLTHLLPDATLPMASTLLTAASVLLLALLVMRCVETPRNRLLLWLGLLAAALVLRITATLHIYIGADQFALQLPVLLAGLALAALLLRPLMRCSDTRQRQLAIVLVVLICCLALLIPVDPDLQPLLARRTLTTWMRMATPGFRGLLRTIAATWPLAVLYFFVIEAPTSSARRPRPAASVNGPTA